MNSLRLIATLCLSITISAWVHAAGFQPKVTAVSAERYGNESIVVFAETNAVFEPVLKVDKRRLNQPGSQDERDESIKHSRYANESGLRHWFLFTVPTGYEYAFLGHYSQDQGTPDSSGRINFDRQKPNEPAIEVSASETAARVQVELREGSEGIILNWNCVQTKTGKSVANSREETTGIFNLPKIHNGGYTESLDISGLEPGSEYRLDLTMRTASESYRKDWSQPFTTKESPIEFKSLVELEIRPEFFLSKISWESTHEPDEATVRLRKKADLAVLETYLPQIREPVPSDPTKIRPDSVYIDGKRVTAFVDLIRVARGLGITAEDYPILEFYMKKAGVEKSQSLHVSFVMPSKEEITAAKEDAESKVQAGGENDLRLRTLESLEKVATTYLANRQAAQNSQQESGKPLGFFQRRRGNDGARKEMWQDLLNTGLGILVTAAL